jgi:hypothetical protein
MKRAVTALVISGAMVLASGTAFAMQRGNGGGPKPKPATGAAHAPKAPAGAKMHGGAKAAGTVKPHGGAAGAKSPGRSATKPAKAAATKPTKTPAAKPTKTTGAAAATTTTTTTTSTTTLSPVQQKLQQNTKLAAKLDGRLPAGTDVIAAASGFRNLGQFVAAVNVSNNLGIPFAQLKSRMVDDGMSLGRAIQDLRPLVDSTAAVRRAEQDATIIIDGNDTVTSTPTKGKPKAKKGSGG